MTGQPDFTHEAACIAQGHSPVCGVDEAGRGPWAGPVTVAAVILDPAAIPRGLGDSKQLSEAARTRLAPLIQSSAVAWSVVHVEADEIDRLNILAATMAGMARALASLAFAPAYALIDGNRMPAGLPCPATTLVKGDGRSLSIAAASILAKTARDALMIEADRAFPGYGFAAHKGYGTATHAAALAQLGPCAIHRLSFKPVKAVADSLKSPA
ncbi:MAG: ribonuclease HII [Hyphomonadaceae bacterium]|nr:ribonuclease HII [Hyphomonadaceae bacterium]